MTEQTSRLAIVIDSTGAKKDAESLTDALVHLATKGKLASEELDSLGNTADEQANSLRRLLRQVDPVGAAFEKLSKQRKLLQDAFDKKLLREDDFKRFDSILSKQQNSLAGISDQLNKTGISAKQTAAAMRMVPAQMTDIIVSLQGGQAPLTVLLQQGGQLKDMFGGIGPAAKALGGYVTGMINPFTLSAGAAGLLGAALYSAEKQASALNKAANSLSNISGMSLNQIRALAQGASALGVSYGDAVTSAGALTQALSSNSDMYPRVIKASSDYSKASGQDLNEVIGLFNQLSSSGGKSIDDLDDKLGFLTVEQRAQADEALRSGNIADAQRIAFEALTGKLEDLTNKLNQGATGWDNFWKAAGSGVSGGWGMFKEIVGGDYLNNQDVARYQQRKQQRDAGISLDKWTAENERHYQMLNNASPAVRAYIQAQEQLSKTTKEAAGSNYLKDLSKQVSDNADAVTKAKEAIIALDNAYRNQPKAIQESGAGNYQARRLQLENRLADAEKAAKNKTPKGKAYTEDAATRLLDQLNQQTSTLQNQFETTEKIGSAQQSLIKWEQQLADIKTKKILTADQKSLLANQDSITAKYQENAALEKQVALRRELEKLTAFKNMLSSGLQNDAAMLQNSLNSNTVLSKEQKRQQELTKISTEFQKKQTELTNQRTTGQISGDLYKQETDVLQAALNERLAMQQAYYMQLDQLNGNWQMGVQNGLQSYMNSVPSLYESVTAATTSILSTTETAISSNLAAMLQGTESLNDGFKNMATGMGQAVIEALTKMAAQWLVYQAVQMVVGKTAAAGASAAMIGQATAMSQIAGINAYASAAAIPITGWAMAPGAMATALAATTPLIASIAASSAAMTAGAGFMSGGYTGNMATNAVAGWVHGQEYVFDAAATKKIGVSNLEALRNGRPLDATLGRSGFGTGAKNVSNSSMKTVNNFTANIPPVTINGNPSDATIQLVEQAVVRGSEQGYRRVVNDMASGRGEAHKALVGGYNTSRRTG